MKLEERRNSLNEKLARKEKKKEKKRRKLLKEGIPLPPELQAPTAPLTPPTPPVTMADTEQPINGSENQLPPEQIEDMEEQERKEEEERKKNREPPIVYKDVIDVSAKNYFFKQ